MRISVYITSFNQREDLARAVQSVLSQTLMPFEVIVVDDASTDGSQDFIRDLEHQHPALIRSILHKENLGVARSRVDALAAVRGEFATYVDGDDRFLPHKLEIEAEAIRSKPGVALVYSNVRYVGRSGETLWTWVTGDTHPPEGMVLKETVARAFPRRSLFRMELVNYEAWQAIGFHNPTLPLYEDYDMRIRLTSRLATAYTGEVGAEVLHHSAGLSSRPANDHLDALHQVWTLNQSILDRLSTGDREWAERRFRNWASRVAVRAVGESLWPMPPSPNEILRATRHVLANTLGWRIRRPNPAPDSSN